jgi:talin
LKVSLPDESIRAVIVDWSAPAEEAIRDIGDKAKISNFLEYSLRKFRDGEVGPWIKSSFTLPEQWVGDNDTLALRKRFFSSDATVDTADPQELHQLYCQLRELVVAGTLPTKQDEAMELAGLMAQIDWGNFDPRKHTQGFIAEINRYLPKQYTKKHKKGEQEILSRYQRLVGMDRTVAKYRFVQLCRSLKFYGITFFEVQVCFGVTWRSSSNYLSLGLQTKQDPKTKKAKPVLFGVTRDAFLFLDIKTHEVVRQFKFSQLRRYTPGQGSITLDFGDHTDDYMTLFTKDGELIVESITGYIDLALRRMKGASARENEDRDAEYASASRVAATFGLATVSQTVSTSPPIVRTIICEPF